MTIGKIIKSVAGGFVNKTIARLKGSRISYDSRLVNAKAKWSGRDTKKDWRVRLQVPQGSPLETFFFDNNTLLEPLKNNRGIFWPLTPNMIIQHSANFNALAQTHSNYPFQAYQNSQVDQMNIIGEFPVQNAEDAKHWVATVHFLRAVTKMFFGNETDLKGNPPPILHLSGYGDHMFNKVPVVINTFNVELRAGIDYISTKQSKVYFEHAEEFSYMNDPEKEFDATWAPTLSNISVLITPIYSRDSVKTFSMHKFVRGELNGKGNEVGFI